MKSKRDRAEARLIDALNRYGVFHDSEGISAILDVIEIMITKDKKSKEEPTSSPTWEAYKEAFKKRYQDTEPVRNLIVNNQVKQLISRVGINEAPILVQFYLTLGDAYYVRMMHSVGQCLKDAETLMARMRGARKVSEKEASKTEAMQDTARSSFEYLKSKHK